MKYERLTEKDRYWKDEELWTVAQEPTVEEIDEIYNRLAELEDKIESGTLIELPCKVGDTVYYALKDEDLFVGKVAGIAIEQDAIWVHAKYESGLNMWHTVEEFGKSIFLTKAEAEKKLAELRGER